MLLSIVRRQAVHAIYTRLVFANFRSRESRLRLVARAAQLIVNSIKHAPRTFEGLRPDPAKFAAGRVQQVLQQRAEEAGKRSKPRRDFAESVQSRLRTRNSTSQVQQPS